MDFTAKSYRNLLDYLKRKDYSYQLLSDFCETPDSKSIILRHDVDKLPHNALDFARIEQEMGIKGTYFFRIVPQSFDPKIIEEIAGMGHEVGYHYEDLSLAAQSMEHGAWSKGRRRSDAETKGLSDKESLPREMRLWSIFHCGGRLRDDETMRLNDGKIKNQREADPATSNQQPGPLFQKSIELFHNHLTLLRKYTEIRTICMHGTPLSRWDSRLLWKYYDYHEFGIDSEPYFDINFEEMLYLTDTGRRWNGAGVSVRDRLVGSREYIVGRGGDGETLRGGDFETPTLPEGLRRTGKRLRDGETERKREEDRATLPAGRQASNEQRAPVSGEPNTSLQSTVSSPQNPDPFHDWKVQPIPGSLLNPTPQTIDFQNQYNFRHTSDIIRAAENNELPDKIMFTFHPQRWTDRKVPWLKELIWQNTKNVAKYFLIRLRD